MPIMTMLVSMRPSGELGHSPSASRASITWPTISAGSRLRTSFIVPVWQKRQLRVQPTWLDTHSVPRSASGMNTISKSWPSWVREQPFAGAVGRHLRLDHFRPGDGEALDQPGLLRLGDIGHRRKVADARGCRSNARSAWRAAWPASAPAPPPPAQRGFHPWEGRSIRPCRRREEQPRAERARDRRGRESASGWYRRSWQEGANIRNFQRFASAAAQAAAASIANGAPSRL